MPASNPKQVILVPGADALAFEEDRAEAERRDIVVRELTLPPFSGHPIDDRKAHFNAVAVQIAAAAQEMREQQPQGRLAAIGRNNGGGQLAWALATTVALDAVVLVGAIPEISLYRKESNSPSAVTFRDSLSSDAEYARIDEMQPLDIVNSSKQWAKTRCLLQFGLNDPYIDETATAAADTLASDHRVEWLDDDHAMVSPHSLEQRWSFIEAAFAPE